jgi:hypothetical protein
MKCPVCQAEIAEGGQHCDVCGGRVTESGIDYSQMRRRASEVDDTGTEESPGSDWIDNYDEHLLNMTWARFAAMLVGTPLIAFLLIVYGLEHEKPYHLMAGIAFACLSIMLIAIYIKAYGGRRIDRRRKKSETSPPRFYRRI